MTTANLVTNTNPIIASSTPLANCVPIMDSMGDLNAFITAQSSDTPAANTIVLGGGDGTLTRWGVAKNNLTATTDPTINTDSTLGYSAGSLWVNTTSGTGGQWVCLSATAGAAKWALTSQNPSASSFGRCQTYNGQKNHFNGHYNDYQQAAALAINSAFYTRTWLPCGITITKMETALNAGAASTNMNMAIYNEVNFNPNSLMAQTGVFALPTSSSVFVLQNLLKSWTVPASDYYWLAFAVDSATPTFFVTLQIILPLISRMLRGETVVSLAMPPVATPLITNSSRLVYLAAVE